jgi:hypothetical protein
VSGFVVACVALLVGFANGQIIAVLLGAFGLILSIGGYADRKRRGRGLAVAGLLISAAAVSQGVLEMLHVA